MAALPSDQQKQFSSIDDACQRIAEVFSEKGLPENDAKKAQEIYVGLLIGKEENNDFYDNLVWCFQSVSEEVSLYDNIVNKFFVSFTDEEKQYLDEKYGITEISRRENSNDTNTNVSESMA